MRELIPGTDSNYSSSINFVLNLFSRFITGEDLKARARRVKVVRDSCSFIVSVIMVVEVLLMLGLLFFLVEIASAHVCHRGMIWERAACYATFYIVVGVLVPYVGPAIVFAALCGLVAVMVLTFIMNRLNLVRDDLLEQIIERSAEELQPTPLNPVSSAVPLPAESARELLPPPEDDPTDSQIG
ncbi:MAG: hypothetical protein OXG02_11135 [Chloroflexi bacterium]|nr:hypothetical protein [Chloroflexota bacterium]MCY4107239.1 hypothetical protein [Chloroflexota bacterium]